MGRSPTPEPVPLATDDLANAFASIDTAIVIVDNQRRVRLFTAKAGTIMELEVGRRIPDLDAEIASVIATREIQTISRGAHRLQVRPFHTRDECVGGAVVSFLDVSTRSSFLSALSDELRTPLSAIMLWTDVLRGLDRDDPDRAIAIDTIAECARAESQLVDDLLDLAMSSSGELLIEPSLIKPSPIIEGAIETLRRTADEKQVTLVGDLDDTTLWADPQRFHQVVTKLLLNAIEFTAIGTEVRVVIKHGELRVIDRGPGIDPAFVANLFEPFAQRDSSKARAHRGLGIGLALVRYLVERQGGTIDVETTVGGGSTFIVRFITKTM